MSYRTVEIAWLPRSSSQWKIFTDCRMESARLWSDLVDRHFQIRKRKWKWPTKARWYVWAKHKYPNLAAQSVQEIIIDFLGSIESTKQLRHRNLIAKYPWHKSKYRYVPYTNQSARIRGNYLLLPNGKLGTLKIRLPTNISLPGRLMEASLHFGKIYIVCKILDIEISQGIPIGIDLGVNTLIAATDNQHAVLVSGRGIKATVQWRNKRLASIQQKQSVLIKGSSRWRKLQRRKRIMLAKAQRRIKDSLHKATRQIANEFPYADAFVGEPFNDASQRINHIQAQTVSQAANRKIIDILNYKLGSVTTINEAYSSQTCPSCGNRSKHKRIFRCVCGVVAPRDVIGATNILSIGKFGSIQTGIKVPIHVKYLRPDRSSSGGHPGNSSYKREVSK